MDNENIIDFKEWKVPTKWDDITLKTFQEIQRYYADKEKSVDIREILHILTNKSIDEVNALPSEFLEIIMTHLVFLQTEPDIKKPSNIIELNGDKYIINTQNKLKVGEYVACETLLKADRYNYAGLLAILARKDGEIYDSKFENEVLPDRITMFENMSMLDAMPSVSFFLQLYMTSKAPSLLSTQIKEAINQLQQSIESSHKNGEVSKLSMKLQMKKLKRLKKSINSI